MNYSIISWCIQNIIWINFVNAFEFFVRFFSYTSHAKDGSWFMLDLIGDGCKNDGGQFVFSTSTWECFVIEIFMVGALL